LRAEPRLIETAVEELLRFAGPLETATERYAREDVLVAGVVIPRGSVVFAALASANRDAAQFPDPDRFDVARQPNRHLAFGLGSHVCLGAPLARMEGQVAIGALLRQASLRLGVAPGDLRWRKGTGTAGAQRVADHMGEMRMNAEVLLWCAVINYGLLLVWVALFVLPHGWMYRLWGRWFRLSAEQFDLVNFAGIVLYKSAVLLFNLVPYIALRIAG
jgi:hypothetical protein